jgi:hypothetical protein
MVASGINATRGLAFAHDIPRILVPSVMHQNSRFQAYARDKVGGDLVDLTAAGTKWLAMLPMASDGLWSSSRWAFSRKPRAGRQSRAFNPLSSSFPLGDG